jgi:UDP-N-acetyl-D-glucosamine dehydrogenase
MDPTPAQKLAVIGQGYVGVPLAMRAAEVGFHVVGFDVDEHRVKRLSAGQSFVEDVTSAQLQQAIESGRYEASAEPRALAGFDIAVITVPTPLREGNPDLSYIEDASRTIARYVRPGCTVILESTTYPGTTEELVVPILEEGSGLVAGQDFHVGYSPERIDPGNPQFGVENTPKVVSGIDDASLAVVGAFYGSFIQQTVPVGSCKVAELTKLLENTFRHVNIALVNELAMFAADLGINVWEAIDAASTKPFGYMRFTPGPGVGGHCLPIDPSYLSWRVKRTLGQSFRFVELANDVNDHMPDYVVRRLMYALNRQQRSLNGSRVLLLGLSYKKNSSDARESPAVVIADRLVGMGADVRAADPHVVEGRVSSLVKRVELSAAEVKAADVVVVLTDHDAFDMDLVVANASLIFDTRRCLTPGPTVELL